MSGAVVDDPAFLALLTIIGDLQCEIVALETALAAKGVVGPEDLEKLKDRAMSRSAEFRKEFLRVLRETQHFLNDP